MSDVEMDDFVDTKLCVKCGGEKSGTYDDRKSLFASKPGTLSFNIFLISILMVEFWKNLKHDKYKMLENMFDSEYPSINQNHEISTKLFK